MIQSLLTRRNRIRAVVTCIFWTAAACAIHSEARGQASFYDFEYIDINNIKAAHSVHGDFWHSFPTTTPEGSCEYPQGSGKILGAASSLWMGGLDAQGMLHAAATMYRENGEEYWPGPLLGQSTSINYTDSRKWARIWKISKADILDFLSLSSHTLANAPTIILEWPAMGNVHAKGRNNSSLVITESMAPFVDVDADGLYDPLQGDYPDIKGDQMLWFVFTDAGPTPHDEITKSPAIGVEVKASVYGYKNAGSLDNVLFYEFELRNTQQTLDSFVVGTFADLDIGDADDDYVGFDSSRNMGFVYNARNLDSNGQSLAYGDSIPSAGIRMLEFPGSDCATPSALGCFIYFYNSTVMMQRAPDSGRHVYGYLNHTWRDGNPLAAYYNNQVSQVIYSDGTGGGPPVNYVYDGSQTPVGPWTECNLHQPPLDMRIVIAGKPFTFQHDQKVKFAFALVASERKYHNACPGYDFNDLSNVSDSAQYVYCHPLDVSTHDIALLESGMNIYPNPTYGWLRIDLTAGKDANVILYDITGRRIVASNTRKGNDVIELNVSNLTSGVYYIQVTTGAKILRGKFIKY